MLRVVSVTNRGQAGSRPKREPAGASSRFRGRCGAPVRERPTSRFQGRLSVHGALAERRRGAAAGRGVATPPSRSRPLSRFAFPHGSLVGRMCGIDPSAGSPTETLLRLLLPLNDKVQTSFEKSSTANRATPPVPRLHRTIQSVGATGGVYKGQGRNQRELMTRAY